MSSSKKVNEQALELAKKPKHIKVTSFSLYEKTVTAAHNAAMRVFIETALARSHFIR